MTNHRRPPSSCWAGPSCGVAVGGAFAASGLSSARFFRSIGGSAYFASFQGQVSVGVRFIYVVAQGVRYDSVPNLTPESPFLYLSWERVTPLCL